LDQLGDIQADDFPIDLTKSDQLKLFNSFPVYIQGLAIQFGISDTECREEIFTLLCARIGFKSPKDYYASDIAKNYFKDGTLLSDEMRSKIFHD
jgi:hypothetical protein